MGNSSAGVIYDITSSNVTINDEICENYLGWCYNGIYDYEQSSTESGLSSTYYEMYNEFGHYRAFTINDTVCLLEYENYDQTDAYCVE